MIVNARRISAAGALQPSGNLVVIDGDVADPETAASLTGSVDLLEDR